MMYWHIQMNQPWGRNGGTIDSIEMLLEDTPVIGTGEWDDIQCRYFKNSDGNGMKTGDIVLVREGKLPIALCKVVGENFEDDKLEQQYHQGNFREVKVLALYENDIEEFPQSQGTLQRLVNMDTDSWKFIDNRFEEYKERRKMKKVVDILRMKNQIILQGPPGTGKTYTAKDIAYSMIFGKTIDPNLDRKEQLKELKKSEQFEIVQFHPAYSYEDFVRGISAQTMDGHVEYKTENKTLGKFAQRALKNHIDSNKQPKELSLDSWLDRKLEDFKDVIRDTIDESEKYPLNKTAYIYSVEDTGFRYKGDSWSYNFIIPYTVLKDLYSKNINERKDIKALTDTTGSAKQHATYYFSLLEKFKAFVGDLEREISSEVKVEPKNYVLIIDEINRANLPAVLGELIYALEYRGEAISSMYDIEGDREIILPPNLFIIGTMNTADRSVGHIDYAIRRRFAFVDVLPLRSVVEKNSIPSAIDLFDKVMALFCKQYTENLLELEKSEYLSPDFNPTDVMIGHSYFLAKDEKELMLKLQNEIKPILREYCKDGILIGDDVLGTIQSL